MAPRWTLKKKKEKETEQCIERGTVFALDAKGRLVLNFYLTKDKRSALSLLMYEENTNMMCLNARMVHRSVVNIILTQLAQFLTLHAGCKTRVAVQYTYVATLLGAACVWKCTHDIVQGTVAWVERIIARANLRAWRPQTPPWNCW